MKNFILLACILFPPLLFSQEAPPAVRVAENLYTVELEGCKAAFLVTDSGVLVVDAGISIADGKKLKQRIETTTDKPLKYLVLTHHHFDHVGGVSVFLPGARIIAQAKLEENLNQCGLVLAGEFVREVESDYKMYEVRQNRKADSLRKAGAPLKADSVRGRIAYYRNFIDDIAASVVKFKPDITFDKEMELILGGEKIVLEHPGPSHTGADCIVRFVGKKTCHVGDLYFEKSFPYIDSCAGAKIGNWSRLLKKLSGDKTASQWICGHGSISGRRDFLTMRNFFSDLRKEVRIAVKKDLSLTETVKAVKLEKYKDYPGRDLLEKNIRVLYYEIKKN